MWFWSFSLPLAGIAMAIAMASLPLSIGFSFPRTTSHHLPRTARIPTVSMSSEGSNDLASYSDAIVRPQESDARWINPDAIDESSIKLRGFVDRDGFVMGEGAGVVMLEEYEAAKARGATIYAELVGFGMSGDAYHMTSPPEDGEGAAASMQNAINDAKLDASEIGYVNAHGTSTPAGDIAEVAAVKRVFNDHAHKLLVSSTKSMTGHLLGAAGSVEAIFTILALRDKMAPPTINLDEPGEGCDLDFVAHKAKAFNEDYALCNSFGFGGTNGSLIFKRI